MIDKIDLHLPVLGSVLVSAYGSLSYRYVCYARPTLSCKDKSLLSFLQDLLHRLSASHPCQDALCLHVVTRLQGRSHSLPYLRLYRRTAVLTVSSIFLTSAVIRCRTDSPVTIVDSVFLHAHRCCNKSSLPFLQNCPTRHVLHRILLRKLFAYDVLLRSTRVDHTLCLSCGSVHSCCE